MTTGYRMGSTSTQLDIVPFDCCSFGRGINGYSILPFTQSMHVYDYKQTIETKSIPITLPKGEYILKKKKQLSLSAARTVWESINSTRWTLLTKIRSVVVQFTYLRDGRNAFDMNMWKKKKTSTKSNMIKESTYYTLYRCNGISRFMWSMYGHRLRHLRVRSLTFQCEKRKSTERTLASWRAQRHRTGVHFIFNSTRWHEMRRELARWMHRDDGRTSIDVGNL